MGMRPLTIEAISKVSAFDVAIIGGTTDKPEVVQFYQLDEIKSGDLARGTIAIVEFFED